MIRHCMVFKMEVKASEHKKLHIRFRKQTNKNTYNKDNNKTSKLLSSSSIAKKTKLRGRSSQANYTERATAACRRS
jgi:hypothetical protein